MVRITILEDDEQLGALLKRVLSQPQGVEVVLHRSGEDALLDPVVPDIVYCDTNLLGPMTGPEAVEKLRPLNPNLAVVYSSGMGLPDGVMLQPQDRVLVKPFDIFRLAEQAADLITRVPRLRPPPAPGLPPPSAGLSR